MLITCQEPTRGRCWGTEEGMWAAWVNGGLCGPGLGTGEGLSSARRPRGHDQCASQFSLPHASLCASLYSGKKERITLSSWPPPALSGGCSGCGVGLPIRVSTYASGPALWPGAEEPRVFWILLRSTCSFTHGRYEQLLGARHGQRADRKQVKTALAPGKCHKRGPSGPRAGGGED